MAANESRITRFPGGVAQLTYFVPGAGAGNVTVTGVKATDYLVQVQKITFDGNGYCTAGSDVTSEFTITADNTINNSGGNTTANLMLAVTVARTRK